MIWYLLSDLKFLVDFVGSSFFFAPSQPGQLQGGMGAWGEFFEGEVTPDETVEGPLLLKSTLFKTFPPYFQVKILDYGSLLF